MVYFIDARRDRRVILHDIAVLKIEGPPGLTEADFEKAIAKLPDEVWDVEDEEGEPEDDEGEPEVVVAILETDSDDEPDYHYDDGRLVTRSVEECLAEIEHLRGELLQEQLRRDELLREHVLREERLREQLKAKKAQP